MTNGSSAFVVDTNVLVYAYDINESIKHDRAIEVLGRLESERNGALTAQVLGEFFVTVTRKIRPPLAITEAERSISNYRRSWPVHEITSVTVASAIRATRRHGLSYWDALVWATARLHEARFILTEDFSDGARIEGIQYVNPFTRQFDLRFLDRVMQ
ncbi:MAG: PIN domain-containing protein [Dehalococcoidia bacterium]